MSDTAPTVRRMYHPAQVQIEEFALRRADESYPQTGEWHRFTVTLTLREALGANLVVERVSMEGMCASIETLPQGGVIDLMLNAVTEALARERADIPPGTRTPESIAVPVLGHREPRAGRPAPTAD